MKPSSKRGAPTRASTVSSWDKLGRKAISYARRLKALAAKGCGEGRAAWTRYQTWVKAQEAMRLDRQFFPAVIELQETPPSPTAHILMRLVFFIIASALLWSVLGHIDIIATGQGKIVPTGRTKVLQPLEAAVITGLKVEEGQHVRKGDVLVELDTTLTEADKQRLAGEKMVLTADVARLNALIAGEPMPDFSGLPPELQSVQKHLFDEIYNKHLADILGLRNELAQHQSDKADAEQQVKRLSASAGLLAERSGRIAKLVKEGYYARNRYDLDETDRLRTSKDLDSQRQHTVQADAAIAATTQKISSTEADYRRTLLADLSDRQDKLLTATKELEKAAERDRQQTLTAPIDGMVQELKVHTLGGVVTPAQELMKIVPMEDALEAEVMIPNKDIGFVKDGHPVAIKLEAFPFTKYGLLHGHVKTLSLDAVQDEKLGLVYAARIAINESSLLVGENTVPLTPGLAVTAEIKTGSRRIIEYFLSPLMEYAHDSIQER